MHLYEPIKTQEKLQTSISLAIRQPSANERMVEAFVLASWNKDRKDPKSSDEK